MLCHGESFVDPCNDSDSCLEVQSNKKLKLKTKYYYQKQVQITNLLKTKHYYKKQVQIKFAVQSFVTLYCGTKGICLFSAWVTPDDYFIGLQ